MNEESAILGFSIARGVGAKGFQKLIKYFGSATTDAWDSNKNDFEKAGLGKAAFIKFNAFRKEFNAIEYQNKLKKAKVEFIPFGSKEYPEQLKKIPDPPIGLFAKGNIKLLSEINMIGVVGARKITSYGKQVTESLVSELCSAEFIIVSGMAMGVDAVSHKTAIDSNESTIAVLGCGADCPYPRENEKLYEEILDSKGLVISEYPLGQPANQGTFPARNRIIAALSKAVLITEAAEDSGSLITADYAVEFGKKVFAVPGPITSQMSKGTLKLLKQGAVMVSSVSDIIEELGISNNELRKKKNKIPKNSKLSKDEKKIINCLLNEGRTIDEISKLTKIKTGKLSIMLSEMELSGLIKNSGGWFKS